ncbi:MAG: DUF1588 domain-containing protein [Gemmataceae bacterium]
MRALNLGIVVFCLVSSSVAQAQDGSLASFVKAHCVKCHGPDKQNGKLRLDTLDFDVVKGPDAERWNEVRDRLLAGEMPPEKEPRPDAFLVRKIIDTLTEQLRANGKVTLRNPPDLSHPRFGNRVDHHALFHPPRDAVAFGPPRLWRLGAPNYQAMIHSLMVPGKNGLVQPFASGETGFVDYAALLDIDEATAEQLIRNATDVVTFQSSPGGRPGRKQPVSPSKEFQALVSAAAPSKMLMESAIRQQFQLVLLRDPTREELGRYVTLMEKNIKAAGVEMGARVTLTAVLLTPEALFRTEVGKGPPDEHGRVRLTPREIAFALAFAITDRRPDAALLAAAEKGELDTHAGVQKQVARLLALPDDDKPRILRFFREYFGYHKAPEVFKNAEDFKDHAPNVLVSDTDMLVKYILARDKDVLYELLTTRKSFVGWEQKPGVKRSFAESVRLSGNAAPSYNLAARPDDAVQPIDLPADQRAGILTQPSWLVAFSENMDNHAILRGKWIREQLLGGTIPDIPISVNAQLPEDPAKTLRERMKVTQAAYCWQCHQKMNPLGLTFEMFDGFGRHRSNELGKPVDASGSIDGSGEKDLDGPVPNALELVRKLAKSERVRQVFVRHAFRYWMGRNETLDDAPTLVAADRAYVESGGSMKALITALLISDSFLYRKRTDNTAKAADPPAMKKN